MAVEYITSRPLLVWLDFGLNLSIQMFLDGGYGRISLAGINMVLAFNVVW